MQSTVNPKHQLCKALTLALVLCLSASHSPANFANPGNYSLWQSGGVIVLPQQRFNPAIQRLLAERTLKALPIYNGELFYIVPTGIDPRHEQAQIQYLEYLLTKRSSQTRDEIKDETKDNAE